MSERPDPVAEAMARGAKTAALLIEHRDQVIHHLAAVFLITDPDGLRACAAGAAEAVILAEARRCRGIPDEGEILPFPPMRAGEGG